MMTGGATAINTAAPIGNPSNDNVTLVIPATQTISATSLSGSIATCTVPSTSAIVTGQKGTIAGYTGSYTGLNGSKTITVISSTQFTFASTLTGTATGTGTIAGDDATGTALVAAFATLGAGAIGITDSTNGGIPQYQTVQSVTGTGPWTVTITNTGGTNNLSLDTASGVYSFFDETAKAAWWTATFTHMLTNQPRVAIACQFNGPGSGNAYAIESSPASQAAFSAAVTTIIYGTTAFTAPMAVLQYSDDAGASWANVRNGTVPLTGSTPVTVVDREVPQGFQRKYQVIVTAQVAAATVASRWYQQIVTAETTLNWWLRDPLTAADIPLSLAPGTFDTISTDRQQVVPVLGRPDPVVLSDIVGLPQLSFKLVFIGDPAYQAFENLRATGHILLLQGPHPMGQYYVRLGDTKNDSTNLPSLRYLTSGQLVRDVTLQAQAVAAP
jgi:hypothetical protein